MSYRLSAVSDQTFGAAIVARRRLANRAKCDGHRDMPRQRPGCVEILRPFSVILGFRVQYPCPVPSLQAHPAVSFTTSSSVVTPAFTFTIPSIRRVSMPSPIA